MDDSTGHGKRVAGMFGRIARWYDPLNRILSFGQDVRWRAALASLALAEPGSRILDLAAGTLDVSLELAKRDPEARVLAVDFSLPMLARGLEKVRRKGLGHRIVPVAGDALNLPVADASVSAVTMAFGIRNVKPRERAFAEALRALAPGGRLCVLEFGTAKRPIFMGLYNLYLDKILPLIGRMVSKDSDAYTYLADTIKAFPDERALAGEMLEAGFARVLHMPLMGGVVQIHVAHKKNRSSGRIARVSAKTGGNF